MSFDERSVEAQARGKFNNLPGEGKPIDLMEYFNNVHSNNIFSINSGRNLLYKLPLACYTQLCWL